MADRQLRRQRCDSAARGAGPTGRDAEAEHVERSVESTDVGANRPGITPL
jgi:hypothetical protein